MKGLGGRGKEAKSAKESEVAGIQPTVNELGGKISKIDSRIRVLDVMLTKEKARIKAGGERVRRGMLEDLEKTKAAYKQEKAQLASDYEVASKRAGVSAPSELEVAPRVEALIQESGYTTAPFNKFIAIAGALGLPGKTEGQRLAASASKVKRARLLQSFVGAPDSVRQKLLNALDPTKGGSTSKALQYLTQDPETEDFRRILQEN